MPPRTNTNTRSMLVTDCETRLLVVRSTSNRNRYIPAAWRTKFITASPAPGPAYPARLEVSRIAALDRLLRWLRLQRHRTRRGCTTPPKLANYCQDLPTETFSL